MLRPVNSNHGLLKKVQSLSTPAIQIRTGAAFATFRKRDSLSPSSVAPVARSSMTVARNNSGIAKTMRNIWIERASCSAGPPENGPCPWAALQIARKLTIEIAVLAPREPNRYCRPKKEWEREKEKSRVRSRSEFIKDCVAYEQQTNK